MNNKEKKGVKKPSAFSLPKDWQEVTLGDLVKIGRGSSPRPIHDYLSESGIPWVKIADATASNTRFINKTKQFIKEEGRSTSVSPGDLIVSNSATPGIPKIMNINACVHDGWLVFDEYKDLDTLFLYYFFLNFRKKLNHSASGSVFKNLKTDIVKAVELNLPPLPQQKQIAKILSSFDNKIELLREQNETLEKIGQEVFKEWFGKYSVDKPEELPEGWRVGKIEDFDCIITDFVANGSFASLKDNVTLYEEENFALFVRNTDLKSSFSEKKFVDKHSYNFLEKTKLFGGEVIISNVGDVGSVHFCPSFDRPMTLGNNIILLRSNYSNILYTLFKSYAGQFLINSITGGSAQPKFNKTDFRNLSLVIPERKFLDKLEFTLLTFYTNIRENDSQIQTLSETRDTLLPKLMKGEVGVKNIINKINK